MKLASSVFLIIVLMLTTKGHSDGLPVPWPFPWAKECPISWQSFEGLYTLAESGTKDQLLISVHPTSSRRGLKLVRAVRLSENGYTLAQGFSIIGQTQKAIKITLVPVDEWGESTVATIKLYYQSDTRNCSDKNLIPILSLYESGRDGEHLTHYRMLKKNK